MCELLGMSANVPTDICFSFTGLMQRGGRTGPHVDGWGIAFFEAGDEGEGTHLLRGTGPAFVDGDFTRAAGLDPVLPLWEKSADELMALWLDDEALNAFATAFAITFGAGLAAWLLSRAISRRLKVSSDLISAMADGDLDTSGSGGLYGVGDGGVGLRIDHRIGQTEFQTRFDAPLWVSRPELAQDTYPGDRDFGLRWTFSFRPAF